MLRSFAELATLSGTIAGVEWASGVRVWQVLVGEDWQHVAEVISGVIFPDRMLSPQPHHRVPTLLELVGNCFDGGLKPF